MEVRSVCVYCGSASGSDPIYAEAAQRFGTILAEAGVRLVYGGGAVGLMGIMAREALARGGDVLGIIPGFLRDREIALTEAGELIVTRDMHERKREMFEHSDAFVALPGGIGTLEETVEMMTWIQLGQHMKPIILANISGFWDPLIALLDHMSEMGFLQPPRKGGLMYQIVDDVEAILPAVRAAASAISETPAALQGDTELM